MSVPSPTDIGLSKFLMQRLKTNLHPDRKPLIALDANDSYLHVNGLWVPSENALTYNVKLQVISRHNHLNLRQAQNSELWLPNKPLTTLLTDGEVEVIDEQIMPLIYKIADHEPEEAAKLMLMSELYDRFGLMIRRPTQINFESRLEREQQEAEPAYVMESIELSSAEVEGLTLSSDTSLEEVLSNSGQEAEPAIVATQGMYTPEKRVPRRFAFASVALAAIAGLCSFSTSSEQTIQQEPQANTTSYRGTPASYDSLPELLQRMRYPTNHAYTEPTPLGILVGQSQPAHHQHSYIELVQEPVLISTPEPPLDTQKPQRRDPTIGFIYLPKEKQNIVGTETQKFTRILAIPDPRSYDPCPTDPMMDDLDLSQERNY